MNKESVPDQFLNSDHQQTLATIKWLNNCQTWDEFNQAVKAALLPLLKCNGAFYGRLMGEQNALQLLGSINQSTCCQHGWKQLLNIASQELVITDSMDSHAVEPLPISAVSDVQCIEENGGHYRSFDLTWLGFRGLVSLCHIIFTLSKSKWSLADALSEEASVVSLEADGSGGFKPRLGADGKPIMITELRASSSRMIALVGMILILLMFLGFGIFAMYSFAKTGVMPNPENMVNFLAAGMTLFAPYLVNQFSVLFEKLAPKKS